MSQIIGYKKNWYKEWFGEDYLTVYQHRDKSDARLLVKLITDQVKISSDSTLLDLACGNGRHAYLFSEFSNKVFGLDLSFPLLKKAQRKKAFQKSPSFVQADMRYFPFKIKFDVIFSLFTSFGYFDTDEKHLKVATEIAACLVNNGNFVIDYFNARYVRENIVSYGQRRIGNITILEKRWMSEKWVHKNIVIKKPGEEKYFQESVRMFELPELSDLLNKAGIKIQKVFGNYDGSNFSKDSKRMVIFAEKISGE
jgi:SAM-dependent methyltransferase